MHSEFNRNEWENKIHWVLLPTQFCQSWDTGSVLVWPGDSGLVSGLWSVVCGLCWDWGWTDLDEKVETICEAEGGWRGRSGGGGVDGDLTCWKLLTTSVLFNGFVRWFSTSSGIAVIAIYFYPCSFNPCCHQLILLVILVLLFYHPALLTSPNLQ